MYSGDLRFKYHAGEFSTLQANARVISWPLHQPPYPRLLMVFLCPSRQISIQYLKLEPNCFLSNPFFFFIH
jgi:hypothetical protein